MKRMLLRAPIPVRLILASLILVSPTLRAQEDTVSRAMHDEMRRSIEKLRLEQLEKPYFISYLIVDNESKEAAATLGSVLTSSESHTRSLEVTVRVGDYQLDNSHFLSVKSGFEIPQFGRVTHMPLDDDYNEFRRQIWLATDRAYKTALQDLSGKRAALQGINRNENTADFSKAPSVSITDLGPRTDLDLQKAARLVRDASAAFRQAPWIQTSRVDLFADDRLERYLNSEGSTFTRRVPQVSLRITASTQAADGMPLEDFVTLYGYSMQDLPSGAVVLSRIHELEDELGKLQAAPVADRYEGPVLFEGPAAAEVFARYFAALLPATPSLVVSSNVQSLHMALPSNGLRDRLGLRVLPDFIDVVDDPTATHERDGLLFGGYKTDEEGVASKRTLVVEHGVLKTVLTSRAPVQGVLESTGNMRERDVAPSNLFISSDKSLLAGELRKQLIESAKSDGYQYGIIVRRLSGKSATLTYRVYEDGHEELLRNAAIADLNSSSFKRIRAVSDQRVIYTEAAQVRSPSQINMNLPPVSGSQLQGWQPLVSYVVPSLLFDEVTVEKPSREITKPTVIDSPLLEKQ
jgi:predicted Zn-dependent protease